MRNLLCATFSLLAGGMPHAWAFNPSDLQGLWAESLQSRFACVPNNRHQRIELSKDGRTLTITVVHRSASRKSEVIALDVLKTDEHSLYFRFPGAHAPSDPFAGEWAITMLGPGVYRWHMTSEHETLRPAPIGVRCEP